MPHTTGGRAPFRPGPRTGGAPAGLPRSRGCLLALSRPPLILFLAVVGTLLLLTALHDLFLL